MFDMFMLMMKTICSARGHLNCLICQSTSQRAQSIMKYGTGGRPETKVFLLHGELPKLGCGEVLVWSRIAAAG